MLISTALLLEIVISVIMYVLRQNCRAAGWWRIIKIIIILAIKKLRPRQEHHPQGTGISSRTTSSCMRTFRSRSATSDWRRPRRTDRARASSASQSDVYAFGIIMFQMVAMQLPFCSSVSSNPS
jgi:serine/threonine protein kinase